MISAPGLATGAALASVLAGCAGTAADPDRLTAAAALPVMAQAQAQAQAPAAAAPPVRAQQLADALVLADTAESRGDAAALARAALVIDRISPKPHTDSDDEALRRWRGALPADAPPPLRGRALGPGYRSAVLMPGATAQLSQTFLGGRSAQIAVRIAQGSALQLMVRDSAEREVCRADRNPVNCQWVPLYTQRHNIEIINTGREVSRIYIVFD